MNFLAPEIAHMDFTNFMRQAMREADASGREYDLPIGAVVVINGQIIARGRSARKHHQNQLRHAELNALLEGGLPLWENYERAVLITTVEPCPLCLGAAVMADVPHIIYALSDKNVHSKLSVDTNPYIREHIRSYYGGVLAEEVKALVSRYDPAFLEVLAGKSPNRDKGARLDQ